VLDGADQNVAPAPGLGGAEYGPVVRLGAAGAEPQLLRLGADRNGETRLGGIDAAPRGKAGGMARGWIAVESFKVALAERKHLGVQRGGSVGVEVKIQGHPRILPTGSAPG
jgi:hypothetical protein